MKRTILFLLLVFVTSCVSFQEATKEEMNHEFIVEYPDLNKQLIFEKTLKWIANNFKSAKQVIEYQDKDGGSIIGNGSTALKAEGALLGSQLEFTMNIDIKDGRVRYRFINLYLFEYGIRYFLPETQAWHRPAQEKFIKIVESIKAAMLTKDDF